MKKRNKKSSRFSMMSLGSIIIAGTTLSSLSSYSHQTHLTSNVQKLNQSQEFEVNDSLESSLPNDEELFETTDQDIESRALATKVPGSAKMYTGKDADKTTLAAKRKVKTLDITTLGYKGEIKNWAPLKNADALRRFFDSNLFKILRTPDQFFKANHFKNYSFEYTKGQGDSSVTITVGAYNGTSSKPTNAHYYKNFFTFTGFTKEASQQNATTSIPATNALKNINKPAYLMNDTDLKASIINNNLIKDAASGFSSSNLQIIERKDNNITGQVKCKIKIIGNKGLVNGKPTNVTLNNNQPVIFTGFTPMKSIGFKDKIINLVDREVATKFPYEADVNFIKKIILKNLSTFFVDYITNPAMTLKDFNIDQLNNSTPGVDYVTFRIIMKGNYIAADGSYVKPGSNGNLSSTTFQVHGFKQDNRPQVSTSIATTNSLGNIGKYCYNINDDELKSIIINKKFIKNPASALVNDDIEIIDRRDNNITGQISCKLKIVSNKALINGAPGNLALNNNQAITFTGLEKQGALGWKNGNVDLTTDKNVTAITTKQVTTTFLKELILKYQPRFFSNYITIPPMIANDFDIIDLTNTDSKMNFITFKISAKSNYINSDGTYVSRVKPQNLLSGTFKVIGFKVEGNNSSDATTSNTTIPNTNWIEATKKAPYEINDNELKQIIIQNKLIKNAAQDLSIRNLEIMNRVDNNVEGEIRAKVKITGKKAIVNGVPSDLILNNSQPITFSGFWRVEPMTFKNQFFDVSSDPNMAAMHASQVTVEFLKKHVIEYDTNYFENFFVDPPLTSKDINIEELNKNDAEGYITFRIVVKGNYVAKDGTYYPPGSNGNLKSPTIKHIGYKKNAASLPTSSIEANNTLTGIKKTPYQFSDIELKSTIISKKLIKNTDPSINANNLEILEREDNNITGSISCKIKVKDKKGIVNGVASDLVLNNNTSITFNGLQTQKAMAFTHQDIDARNDKSINSIFAPNANVAFVKKWVIQHRDKFFLNQITKPALNENDIDIIELKNNDDSSNFITFKILVKGNYVDQDGKYFKPASNGTLTSNPFKISGFKVDSNAIKSTSMNATNSIKTNQALFQLDDQALKTLILSNNLIADVANDITTSHLNLRDRTDNNITGEVRFKLSIQNNKGFANGKPANINLNNDAYISIKGFKDQKAMGFVNKNISGSKDLTISGIYSSQANVAFIKKFILSRPTQFFTNHITSPMLTEQDIEIKNLTSNVKLGEISFTIVIKGNFVKTDGTYVPPASNGALSSNLIKITGFKNTNITTQIKDGLTTIDLSGSVSGSVNDARPTSIIKALVDGGWINNLQPDTDLTYDKLTVKILSIDEKAGEAIVEITIDQSVAWKDGNAANVKLSNIIIKGYDSAQPTAYKTNTSSIRGSFNNITSNKVTSEMLQEFVWLNRDQFFSGIVEDTTKQNIVIHNDIKPNVINGSLTVTIGINKYLDAKTHKVVSGKELASPPKYTITGFRTEGLTTTVETQVTLSGVNNIFPSEINSTKPDDANIRLIKGQMLASEVFKNVANDDTLELSDFNIDRIVSRNEVKGSIVVDITIKNNKYWENGVTASSKSFKNITLNGFKTKEASSIKRNTVVDLEKNNPLKEVKASTTIDQNLIKDFVRKNIDDFVENPIEGIQNNNIYIENIKPNEFEGSITFNLKIDKFLDVDGQLVNGGNKNKTISGLVTITGFSTDTTTTTITESVINVNMPNVVASVAAKSNINDLKRAIASSGIFNGLKSGTSLSSEHITIAVDPKKANDLEGTLPAQITISKDIALDNGIGTNKTFSITFTGFKNVTPTKFSENRSIDVAGRFSYVSPKLVTAKEIQSYILSNPTITEQFITNLPDNISASDLVVTPIVGSANVYAGTLKINLTLKKYYNSENGSLVTNGNLSTTMPFTLTGFKIDTSVTAIPDYLELKGISNIDASTINDQNSNSTVRAALLNSIKENIKNLPDGKVAKLLTERDFTFTKTSYDNKLGTLVIDLTIKNGNWVDNGNIEPEHTINNITLSGFKKYLPTEWAHNTIVSVKASNLSGKAADNNVTDDMIKSFIVANKDKFFINLPNNELIQNNIQLVDVNRNLTTGEISFGIRLSKYIDENGSVVTSGVLPNSPTFTLNGFDNVGLTTKLINKNLKLSSINTFLATDIKDNDARIKNALLTAVKGSVVDLVKQNGSFVTLNANDILFSIVPDSANNINGSLIIDITITNEKAWANGVKQDMLFSNVMISGFRISAPTTWIQHNRPFNTNFKKYSEDVEDREIKQYILSNKGKFFNNLPDNITTGDFDVVRTNNNGTISFTISLRKYHDANGILQTDGTPLDNSPTYVFTCQKKPVATGYVANTKVSVTGDLTKLQASQMNEAMVREFIVNNNDLFFFNLPSEGITVGDLKINDLKVVNNELTFYITLIKYVDATGKTVVGKLNSTSKFTLTGFNIPDQIETRPGAAKLILNKSTFGTTDASTRYRDDYIKDPATKNETIKNLNNWLKNNRNLIFVDLPKTATITSIELEPLGVDGIKIIININNASVGNGANPNKQAIINITGFKLNPNKLDISKTVDNTNLTDIIENLVKDNGTPQAIKAKIAQEIKLKIKQYTSTNQEMPRYWKNRLFLLQQSDIENAINITIQDTKGKKMITSVTFSISKLPTDMQECLTGDFSWSIKSGSASYINNNKSKFYIFLIGLGASLIVFFFILLLIIKRIKKNKKKNAVKDEKVVKPNITEEIKPIQINPQADLKAVNQSQQQIQEQQYISAQLQQTIANAARTAEHERLLHEQMLLKQQEQTNSYLEKEIEARLRLAKLDAAINEIEKNKMQQVTITNPEPEQVANPEAKTEDDKIKKKRSKKNK